MTRSFATRPIFWVSCCFLFLYFALSLASSGDGMFADTDPLWHIASGDLIRTLGALPEHDPWSFTAGDYRWLNISWLWDVSFSYLHDHFGWHGVVAVNAIIISLVIVMIYVSCLARTGDFFAAMLTTVLTITMLSMLMRPLQITSLMVVTWMLLLGAYMRDRIPKAWLAFLPLSMLLWVNVHGGFLIGGMLIAVFCFQAWQDRRDDLVRPLLLVGVLTLGAMLCNPYGIDIALGTLHTMNSQAKVFIREWQPFAMSPANLIVNMYLVFFVLMVPRRNLPALPAERWLMYFWLLMGLFSNRNLSLFAIVSAPTLACGMDRWLNSFTPAKNPNPKIREAMLFFYDRWSLAIALGIVSVGAMFWLPSSMGARSYHQEHINVVNLDPEIDYIKTHLAKKRILTHYDIAGIVLYQTRGAVPVFIDPRCETAYPASVVKDYATFEKADPDWENTLKPYRIDAVMLPNEGHTQLRDRLAHRSGWKMVFSGPHASIFLRTPK